MLDIVVRLECKRQNLVKERSLQQFGHSINSLWGLAGLVFFVTLFPLVVTAPAAVETVPDAASLLGGLILAGFILCATVVGAPLGLFLL